jgi:membrane protein YfhO
MGIPPSATGGVARRRIALLCLVFAVALLFHPILLGQGVLYFRDVSLNHYPTRAYTAPILRSGHLPLWNPYLSGGVPLAANPNNMILHPSTLLFLFLPVPVAFHAALILQYLLAAWGMYRWGEEEGLDTPSALLAALTYTLSGPIASCGSFQNLLGAWAWVPLALFGWARFRRTGSSRALVMFAIALAVQMVTGDLVAAGTSILAAGLGAVAEDRSSGPSRRRRMVALAGGLLLAVGLSLYQTLPAREMMSISGRASGLPYRDALSWPIEPARLLEMAVPSLYGDPTALTPSRYWGGLVFEKGYPFLLSIYLGAIPLLLIPISLQGAGSRGSRLIAALSFTAIVAALGETGRLYPLLYRFVPLVSSLRYPSRFMLPAAVGLAFLAGRGLHRLRADSEGMGDRRGTRILIRSSFLLSGVILLAGLVPPILRWILRTGMAIPGTLDAATFAEIERLLRGSFLRSGLLLLIPGGLGILILRGRLSARLSAGVMVLVTAVDLIAANGPINPVVPPSFYEAVPAVLKLVGEENLAFRVYHEPRPPGFAVLAGSDSAWWGYYWDQISCRLSTGLPHRIAMAFHKSIDLLSPARVNDLADQMQRLDAAPLRRLCEIGSVGVIEAYRELDDPGLVPSGEVSGRTNVPLRFYHNSTPLPRAYMIGAARPEAGSPLQGLTRPDFDPKGEVYLAGLRNRTGRIGEAGTVEIQEDRPEAVGLQVSAAAAGWVVLTDNYYPGWSAELDGKPVPIRLANYLFRAVEVPAGEHRLRFRYSPRTFRIGGAISAGFLLIAILVALRRGRPVGEVR